MTSQQSRQRLGVFTRSGFGSWNAVLDAFSVSLPRVAPEKCSFTNRAPRLCLKANSITQTKFCDWKVGVLVYTVSWLLECQSWLSIAYLFYGRFIVAKRAVASFNCSRDLIRTQANRPIMAELLVRCCTDPTIQVLSIDSSQHPELNRVRNCACAITPIYRRSR